MIKISSNSNRASLRNPRFWLSVAVFLLIIFTIKSCFFNRTSKKGDKPIQAVVLAKASKQDVPVYLYGLGSVTPVGAITVRTQINGQLMKVNFTEGQVVKRGQLLAEIDPRPYQAQLIQYEGQLERDKALLENARIDLVRYEKLWAQDSTSEQILATQRSLVKQYEGTVKLDKGLVVATKLNLAYCKITSPVNGRTGLLQVDPGNYVQTTDANGIVIVNTEDKTSIVFSLPEDDLPKLQKAMQQKREILIEAYDREQKHKLGHSKIFYLDNQINVTTGTVNIKAEFENKEHHFFANQFVNTHLLVDTLKNVIVIPTAAVQPSTKGDFVYVVDANNIAHNTPVKIQVTEGDTTVIETGVALDNNVVIEGADKLVDGAPVKITNTMNDDTPKNSPHKHHQS